MNKILLVVVGFICIFINIDGYCSEKDNDRWLLYSTTSEGNQYYLDKQSLLFVGQKVFQVWIKEKPSKNRKTRYIQNRVKNGLSTDGWEKWNETKLFQEMDCVKRTLKTIKVVFYNDDGNSLDTDTDTNRKPEPIVPNSLMEGLLDTICPK